MEIPNKNLRGGKIWTGLFAFLAFALSSGTALAGVASFTVEAIIQYPPAITGPGDFQFSGSQSLTFVVLPDPELKLSTGADAILDLSMSYDPVSLENCINPDPSDGGCQGYMQYQAGGSPLFYSGLSGPFSWTSWDFRRFGPQNETIPVLAGTYTVMAWGYTAYSLGPGEVAIPGSASGFVMASFSVIAGDVLITPEPGTCTLLLLGGIAFLARRIVLNKLS